MGASWACLSPACPLPARPDWLNLRWNPDGGASIFSLSESLAEAPGKVGWAAARSKLLIRGPAGHCRMRAALLALALENKPAPLCLVLCGADDAAARGGAPGPPPGAGGGGPGAVCLWLQVSE